MPERDPASSESSPFRDVLAAEWEDIRERRKEHRIPSNPKGPPGDLRGLALSGGGIRSATFCLGVLQRLNRAGVLKRFDYLSTVSGGGFIGGWWSAWLSRGKKGEIFPPEEGLETKRGTWDSQEPEPGGPDGEEQPEGSRSAGTDPVHHLRLFANYLTPRKGALSGDTWRAITVVSRNLFLTVLMLVPLLGAAILASQFYFTADPRLVAPYTCDAAPLPESPGPAPKARQLVRDSTDPARATGLPVCDDVKEASEAEHRLALTQRLAWLALPLLVLAAALGTSLIFWMLFSIGRILTGLVTLAGVAVILALTSNALAKGVASGLVKEISNGPVLTLLLFGAIPIAVLAGYLGVRAWVEASRAKAAGRTPSAGVLTNRITRIQTIILVLITAIGVTLIFGGFAHEAVKHALFEVDSSGSIGQRIAGAGGWLAVLWAAAGALFTGLKAAPTGGGDRQSTPPSRKSQLVFAITPPLVLIVLLMVVATVTHGVLRRLIVYPLEAFPPLVAAFLVAILICFFFAAYEFWTDADAELPRSRLVIGAAAGAGLAVGLAVFLVVHPLDHLRQYTSPFIGLAVGIVAAPWMLRLMLRDRRLIPQRKGVTAILFVILPILGAAIGYGLGTLPIPESMPSGHGNEVVAALAAGGIAFAATFVLMAVLTESRVNHRMLALQTVAIVLLGPMLMQQFLNPTVMQVAVPTAIVALIGIVLGSIIGLGWMLDPNYLSLHTFYKARLVRAYLGASNELRHDSGAEISDSAEGDDVFLASLSKGSRGGPCHLINATLNLVGGRDLTTAQRSAAYFTMSRHYCGSLRTGYRPTGDYMKGRLSLGTAVAVSGAAASPNMGSKTPSAALAMLMALLNVRLGYWAPTPNQARWQSARPRLWPFYLIREFLSQTNDLSLYCYLTDGGHFDNTGLYSLVQRGCRYIVFVDCGADPDPCFSDLGDAIRRCRIDFDADIDLEVENFRKPQEGQPASAKKQHFVVGAITYSERHAADLGWTDTSKNARKGVVVWIKPSLLEGDPAEVRQYALENKVFPQQSTADQWFDEAQFECYRRLGEACADETLADAKAAVVFA
jgi:hypothetical protein